MGANPTKPTKEGGNKLAQQLYDIDPSSTRLDLKNKNIRELPEEIRVLKLLNWLNLPNNNLENLPSSIGELSNLKTLRLLSNKLSSLPTTVANLSNLSVLDISKNQFRLISPCIGSLSSLTELNLQQNLLEAISSDLESLRLLKTLNIYINKLNDININWEKLPALESLDVAHNWLTDLPPSFASLKAVSQLNVSGNDIVNLPKCVAGMHALKLLDARFNKIESVPDEIGELTTLRQLRLRGNNIKNLPNTISRLQNLEELHTSHNALDSIPDSVTLLTALQQLHVYNNELLTLPIEIGNMVGLKDVDICSNNIVSLPASFGKLYNVITLLANSNKFASFTDENFQQLTSVQQLHLAYNWITHIPAGFAAMTGLSKVDLNVNKLDGFPDVSSMKALSWLEVGWNKLSKVPESFSRLQNIVALNLFGNFLTELPAELGQLSSLLKLNVSYNRLRTLPDEFENLKSIIELRLDGNKFDAMPVVVFKMTTLKDLSLSNCSILEIPPAIGVLSALEVLRLTANKLVTVPFEITTLAALIELDLAHNNITTLPAEMGNLQKLMDIDISGNAIEVLPESLAEIRDLLQLKVGFNRLRCLPLFATDVKKRTWINATGNEILSIMYEKELDEESFLQKLMKIEKKRAKKDKPGKPKMSESSPSIIPSSPSSQNSYLASSEEEGASGDEIIKSGRRPIDGKRVTKIKLDGAQSRPSLFTTGWAQNTLPSVDEGSDSDDDASPSTPFTPQDDPAEDSSSSNTSRPSSPRPAGPPPPLPIAVIPAPVHAPPPTPIAIPESISDSPDLTILPPPLCASTDSLPPLPTAENPALLSPTTPPTKKRKKVKKTGRKNAGAAGLDGSGSSNSSLALAPVHDDTMSGSQEIPALQLPLQLPLPLSTPPSPPSEHPDRPSSVPPPSPPVKHKTTDDAVVTPKSPRGTRTPPPLRTPKTKLNADSEDSAAPKSPRALSLSTGHLPRPNIIRTDVGGPEPVVKIVDAPTLSDMGRRLSNAGVDSAWTPDTRAELLQKQEDELRYQEKQLKQKEKEAKDQKNKEGAKQLKQQLQELKVHEKEIKREQKEEKKQRKTVEINIELLERLTSAEKATAKAEGGLVAYAPRRKSILIKEKIEYRRILPEDVFRYRKRLGWAEMRGRRPDMQDTMALVDGFLGVPDFFMLSLFDGHAGTDSAEYAARQTPMVIGNGLRDLFSLSSKDKDKQVKPTSEWVMSLSQDQLKQSLHSAFADLHESIDSSKFTDGTAAMVALVYYPRDRFAAWVAEQSSASSQGKTSPRMSSTTDAVVSPRAPKKRNTVTHSKEDSDAIMSQVSSYSTGHLRSNSFVEHNRNTVDGGSMLRNVNSNSIPKPKARLIIANTGDQRLVLCRNGKAIQVTVDHKPDAPEELDRIRRGGGFVAENRRVNGVLALSRALGDVDLQPHVTYVPDIFFMDLQEDDEFLIMACDGLWDVVSSEQAVQLVQSEHADPIRSATKLRDYAHCLNSTDNISVVVFQLRDPTSTTVRGARARSFGEPNLLNDPKKEK